MDHSLIKYLPPRVEEGSVVWRGQMRCTALDPAEVCFNFTCPNSSAFVPFVRPFVLAFLVPAMRIGLPIQLEQPLDQTTLENLMEWQEAMASWLPDKLKMVPIKCDIAPSPFTAGDQRATSLTAFSGGVDSCFTALRHSSTYPEWLGRRTRLGAGLMIHGFDIPEGESDTFASAFDRSKNILNELGLKAYRMKTNLRDLEQRFGCNWELETHGIWLAASLACLEPFFDRTLIPGSYPYHLPRLPWASNTMTDSLFASDQNDLWHDGGAFDKLGKIRIIARSAVVLDNLRVCWEGKQLDRNCGLCSKCVMTQICLWVCGAGSPSCFEVPCGKTEIETLKHDRYYDHLAGQIRKEARRQGMTQLDRQLGRAKRRARREALFDLLKHPTRMFELNDQP